MIGNDLVDLATARKESNWRRKGFLQKVFSEAEQSIIHNASQPDVMVWVLWSMKESAYKIWNRAHHIRRFNPKSFECRIHCHIGNVVHGEVGFEDLVYHSESTINKAFVHTICQSPECSEKPLYIRFTNQRECIEKKNFIARDASGIPYSTNHNQANDLISISHHGRFCSYLSTFKLG